MFSSAQYPIRARGLSLAMRRSCRTDISFVGRQECPFLRSAGRDRLCAGADPLGGAANRWHYRLLVAAVKRILAPSVIVIFLIVYRLFQD